MSESFEIGPVETTGKFTREQLAGVWRKRIIEHRASETSCRSHGLSDLAKWHEGQADALERAESELTCLLLP